MTTPSPAAMRAAKAVMSHSCITIAQVAAIIDRETGVKELARELRQIAGGYDQCGHDEVMLKGYIDASIADIRAALAKYEAK